MPVIYLDVLLALNLFIDYLLLRATARLLRLPCRSARLLLGAAIGAACACVILLPPLPAPLDLLLRLSGAALLVLAAFAWHGVAAFAKRVGVFLLLSALFGGLAWALYLFAAPDGFYVVNGVVYYDVSPLLLVGLTVAAYAGVRLWDRLTRKSAPAGRDYRLLVEGDAGSVTLRALYDTGNDLKEPFSGRPVAVVQLDALRGALSPAMLDALAAFPDTAGDGGARLRAVPYRAVGGDGLLPAFCPERLTLTDLRGAADVTGAYIAVCDRLGRGDHDAIIGGGLAAALADRAHGKVDPT